MSAYKGALSFLDEVKQFIPREDHAYLARLKKTEKLVKGRVKAGGRSYQAYRAQHNSARGPYKGGIRFHQNVTEGEIKALAFWMSLKTAVAGLPFGGGKGGVVLNPKNLSQKDLEALSRAYMRLVAKHIGVDRDIPAPDVNTNERVMSWMLDEYESITGFRQQGAITGKPLALGGSQGRVAATGRGGVHTLMQTLSKLQKANHNYFAHKPKSQITIAVQGFGNVGYWFAKIASDEGYRVIAVSDSKGGVLVEQGLDPQTTLECKRDKGILAGCYCVGGVCDLNRGKQLGTDEVLSLDVDILVPAALEQVVTAKNVKNIKAKMIVEMANGPVTPEADAILSKREVLVIPDIVANSGGVTVSYLEWVQNRMGYYWDEDEVLAKQGEMMRRAFEAVWKKYMELSRDAVTLRKAAYVVAVEKLIKAERLRRPVHK